MSFPEEEQHPGRLVEQDPAPDQSPQPEPRLLTRPDREAGERVQVPRRRQSAPASDPQPSAKRLVVRPRAATARKRPRRRASLFLRILMGCLLLSAVAIAGGVLYLRRAMEAALPPIDGTVQASGLRAPVTVARDAHGVPTITAANLPDLLFAQGYTTAGDRLWQMDALRRHAAGELAEVLGPSLLEHDKRQRYLQIRAAADRAVAQLPPDQLAQLEAYARGVNAYADAHRDALPLQFRLLAYKPAPWTPRDSLLVSLAMWQDLSTEFPEKLARESLRAHLPPELLADLYPVGSWRDQPPAAQDRDLTVPREVEQIPLDPSQSRLAPGEGAKVGELVAVNAALGSGDRCEGCRSGSNNWAVSGGHTASGAPLVSNDMHLDLAIPDIWYEASLHADLADQGAGTARLDVAGFTLPGTPFVLVGRNARVGWSVTSLYADVQDLRVEHLRGVDASLEYRRGGGSWAPVSHHAETIRVRGSRNVTLDVLTTAHTSGTATVETPIISPLYPSESRALSLAWTAYDPAALGSPFLGVDTAADGASLVTALAHFGGPALNLVWADAEGHIGYHALGLIPVRGPAIQHPKVVAAPLLQPGAAPPDEGSGEPESPEAVLTLHPHLLFSSYGRARRVRRVERDARPAARPVKRAATDRKPKATTLKDEPAEPVSPAGPVVNYTIGSPISPVPVDALDAAQTWTAYVPYESLPAVLDPKNGLLVTANARVAPDDYPYALANDWADSFRAERIVHLLAGRSGLTSADMLRLQIDVHSDVNLALAQRLAYAVDHAGAKGLGDNAAELRDAANLLRSWDGAMRVGSPAAAIVSSVRQALWPALLIPAIVTHDGVDAEQAATLLPLYMWGERTTALETLVANEPSRWLPRGYGNWNDFLASTLAQALRAAHAPAHLARWQYGQVHRVELADPLFGLHRSLSRLLGITASSGAQPAPGDGTTIDGIGAHFGPSERFTADLSSADAATGNITTGQSGNPRSPWYIDQFRPWLEGRTFSLPGADTEARHRLTLRP